MNSAFWMLLFFINIYKYSKFNFKALVLIYKDIDLFIQLYVIFDYLSIVLVTEMFILFQRNCRNQYRKETFNNVLRFNTITDLGEAGLSFCLL